MEFGKDVLEFRISNDNQSPVTKNSCNSYYYLYMYLYISLSTGESYVPDNRYATLSATLNVLILSVHMLFCMRAFQKGLHRQVCINYRGIGEGQRPLGSFNCVLKGGALVKIGT